MEKQSVRNNLNMASRAALIILLKRIGSKLKETAENYVCTEKGKPRKECSDLP